MSTDSGLPDVAQSLSAMAESTTAADLVRQKGQSKRVKVLSERKLVEWITTLLHQQMATREGHFSDAEKEQLLATTQAELKERIARQQQDEAERKRLQAELDETMARLDLAQREGGDRTALDQAITALKQRLAETEANRDELQQDNYELQDQLQAKLALLGATIGEKDKLRDTVRQQMLRSTGLIEGVLGLDARYYGSRHADGHPVADDAGDEERFFHDFDIGAAIVTTLSQDLERLRSITGKEAAAEGDARLLEADLALLQRLKSGGLNALDVAEPVAGLVEALAGTRDEAERLQALVADATGARHQPLVVAPPDADGEAREVLAGCTALARQLAAELAQVRTRVDALRSIADEADAARNQVEDDQRRITDALRTVAQCLVDATKGDAALAEVAGDLALALDDPQAAAELPAQVVSVAKALVAVRRG